VSETKLQGEEVGKSEAKLVFGTRQGDSGKKEKKQPNDRQVFIRGKGEGTITYGKR